MNPSRRELLDFVRRCLQEHDDWCAQSGESFEIKCVEELETMTKDQLKLVASIILALGYESEGS